MKNKKTSIFTLLFHFIIFLVLIKFTFGYLNVELGWWLRHLTSNFDKYNFLGLPYDFQEYIEYAIVPLMVIYIGFNFSKLGSLMIPFFLTFLLYILNIATGLYNEVGLLGSLKFSVKVCAPIYFFIMLVIQYKAYGLNIKKLLWTFVIYCGFLAFVALLIFNPSFNRGSERLPVFFNSIHTHSYVLACLFIGASLLLRKHYWIMYAFMFLSFSFLVLGYNVRTAVLFYFIFIVVMLYHSDDAFKLVFMKIVMYIPFVLGLSLVFLRNVNFDDFSSGRLTMYSKKLNILSDYTTVDYIFGRGKGSDLVKTVAWSWEEKGSHNDFLTYIVENGIPFTLLFVVLILSMTMLTKKVSVFSVTLIIGYLITSAISNGIAVRPLAGYFFFLVFAYSYLMNNVNTEEWQKQ